MIRIIPFYGTVPANSEKTLVSDRLSLPYTIKEVQIHFPPGTECKNRIRVYVSGSDYAPSTGKPDGDNLFAYGGHIEYIVGDNETLILPRSDKIEQKPTWIKVHAENTDSYDHTIDVRVVIDLSAGR